MGTKYPILAMGVVMFRPTQQLLYSRMMPLPRGGEISRFSFNFRTLDILAARGPRTAHCDSTAGILPATFTLRSLFPQKPNNRRGKPRRIPEVKSTFL